MTPGEKHEVELPPDATLSIGMASLGEKLTDKTGRSVVMVTRDSEEAYALCVLRAGATESVPLECIIGPDDALFLSVVGSSNEVHLTGNVELKMVDDDEDSNSDDLDEMNEEMLRNLTGGGDSSGSDEGSDESVSNDESLPLIKQKAVVEELEATGEAQEPTVIDTDADTMSDKKDVANGNAPNGRPNKRAKKNKGGAGGGAAAPAAPAAPATPAAPAAAKATQPAKAVSKPPPVKGTPKNKGNAGATPAKAGAPVKGAAKGTPAASKPTPQRSGPKTNPVKQTPKADSAPAASVTPTMSGKKRRRSGKKEAASPAV